MIKRSFRYLFSMLAMVGCPAFVLTPVTFGEEVQYFPIASSRVGPYSAMGTGYYGAQIDYMNYINMNGGVNGGDAHMAGM